MANFNGQLRSNEIFSALYNMIISQQVFADNIKGTKATLVDKAREDGSLYGDTKLYYATDVLKSAPWGKDAEATNLLALHRPAAPECQAIHLDQFRQISLTVDNYLSKRAWGTEGAFSSFNSVMLGWVKDTKKVYDTTTYNAFIGTAQSSVGKQTYEIAVSELVGDATGEEAARLEGMAIAEGLANLFVEMSDVNRDFNDYANLRSYDMSDIKVIWNSKMVNKIKKVDLPTIFHKEGLVEKFEEYVLPERYFGRINASGGTAGDSNKTVRSLIEKDYGSVHVFPGDLIPNKAAYQPNETYTVDADVICKVVVKLPPYMSAFEVGTSFFNPKSLTENHYLTFGHNTLEYLKNYPMITVKKD